MANPQNTEDVERLARALLEEGIDRRMAAVKELVAARDRLAKAREVVRVAEIDDARAYEGAIATGWTREQLTRTGLKESDKIARVQRRASARRGTATRTPPTAIPAHSSDHGADAVLGVTPEPAATN
jgi:ribonuclease D